MKKFFVMAMAAAIMCGCEKELLSDVANGGEDAEAVVTQKTKKFTFTVKGDFGSPTFSWPEGNNSGIVTRGYLQADGKDMTDLWVFDFIGDQCVNSIHQSDNTAEDFGRPVMNLALGSHHIYFVASRGDTPTLNEDDNTITWTTVRDTFWKDYEVVVTTTSNGNRAVTLDRVATKLKLTVDDEVPTDCALILVTPDTRYNGLNYRTGAPVEMLLTSTTQEITMPSSYIGTTGGLILSIFSLSSSTEWTTGVSIVAKNGNNSVIGSAVIDDVPLKANRATEYHGNLFVSGGTMSTSLNSEWLTAVTGVW